MTSRSIVVLVTGDPVPETWQSRGGYFELIRAAAPGFARERWVSHDVREHDVLPDLTDALGVIITGSAASVTDPSPWIARTGACLRELVRAQVPVLGICFGHQLMSQALGGRVGRNPHGREMGTVAFELQKTDPILGEAGTWHVNATHVDSILELPEGATLLGRTEVEPFAAVRFGPRAWGVQFHPEIDGGVMRQFLVARRASLIEEGLDWSHLEKHAADAPEGARVVERFLRAATAPTR